MQDLSELNPGLILIKKLISMGGKPLGYGSTRVVIDMGNFVYKIEYHYSPFNSVNLSEFNYYSYFNGEIEINGIEHYGDIIECDHPLLLAKCELVKIDGIVVLKMEKVRPISFKSNLYDGAYDIIDGGQIGLNSAGEVVCYDYGSLPNIITDVHQIPNMPDFGIHGDFSYNVNFDELFKLGFVPSYGANYGKAVNHLEPVL